MKQSAIQTRDTKPKRQTVNLTGIPTQMKLDFEQKSGLSFDDVRVHYHSDKPARLGALAYTKGTQVHIGPGQEKHLSHELGHVIQQKTMSIPTTTYRHGQAINQDRRLEKAADHVRSQSFSSASSRLSYAHESPIQLYSETPDGIWSENEQIFLANSGELFATKEQIHQAATVLEKGNLIIRMGPALQSTALHQVIVCYDPSSSDFSSDFKDMIETKAAASKILSDKLPNAFSGAFSDALKKLTPIPDTTSQFSEEQIEAKMEDICTNLGFSSHGTPSAGDAEALVQYINFLARSDKIHLTRDCGELAGLLGVNQEPGHSFNSSIPPDIGYGLKITGMENPAYNASYHWATVIMRDGSDYVTIEAADIPIRDYSNSQLSAEPYMKYLSDPTWSFKVYGTTPGTTFEDKNQYLFNGETSVMLHSPKKKQRKKQ